MPLTTLLLIFVTLVTFSALFNYLFLRWTRTLGTKNLAPAEELRWSESYKPAIGGISFYIIFLVSYAIYLFFQNPDLGESEEMTHFGLLIAVTVGFFTGLADDAFNTVPWLKLAAQIGCGVLLLMFDLNIVFFEHEVLDAFLTIFWTVGMMNSINMLDNMDGITSIVSIFILLAASIVSEPLQSTNLFYTFICGGVLAALIGFLFFNWYPSKVFMGDTGSQMLGALLAAIGVLFFWNNPDISANHTWYSKLAIVGSAFVIPIADSITVTINRIRRGQSPLVGGKDHTTHHLSYAGLNDIQVAMVMILISSISVTFISALSYIDEANKTAFFSFQLLYVALVIVFLYSSTWWSKSRSVFEKTQLNSSTS
ncbi:MAG: MraY family glycosyltransferase [Salibacteraceae bacterium]